MSKNLANLYAWLQRKYIDAGYSVSLGAPPTYLATIAGCNDEKIVFVCKEARNLDKTADFLSPTKLKIRSQPEDELELTGSPLQDTCVVDLIEDVSLDTKLTVLNPWKWAEEHHRGIGVEKVRAIINSQDFLQFGADGSQARACGCVWFLCNGADEEQAFMLEYEFVPGFFSRGIVTFQGVVPTYSVNSQSLLRQHFRVTKSSSQPLKTHIENIYVIKPNISLVCSWATSATLPLLIDLSNCDVILKQTFYANDSGPLTQDLMNQLRILMYIREDILNYKEAQRRDLNKEVVYRCGRGIELGKLSESITQVMTEISGFHEIESDEKPESDIEDVIQRSKLRTLTDLTDKLWDILKCCSSYKDLKMGFNILFQCAARRNIVNTPTNKNRLAEIITEVANHRLAIPCLTGAEALELLLEIGLEKVYKDYEFILTESQICSASYLKNHSNFDGAKKPETIMPQVRKSLHNAAPAESIASRKTLLHNLRGETKYDVEENLGFRNSNFNSRETEQRLVRLYQIHCILEHLLQIHVHLNLNKVYHDVCDQLLKKPLRLVETIDDNFKDEIEISLTASDVRAQLEGKDPNSRRIKFNSKNKFRDVSSTFFFSMENICPPGTCENFESLDKEMRKENMYHSWAYHKIKTVN